MFITVTNTNDNSPYFTSASNANFAENGTGTAYTISAIDADALNPMFYYIEGGDSALFDYNSSTGAVTFKNAPNFEAPADAGGNNVYNFDIVAWDGNNFTSAPVFITVTNVFEMGIDNIALGGGLGNLINPVIVDNNQYYYQWDRDGDGEMGGGDTMNWGSANVANLDGWSVALPTYGGSLGVDLEYRTDSHYHQGTTIDNNPVGESNPTYDGLLAIWDAHNGGGTGWGDYGRPPLWTSTYWSNTATDTGEHAIVNMDVGLVNQRADIIPNFVVLQVF